MRGRALKAILIAGFCVAGIAAARAGWQDEASAYDVKRLSLLEESRAKGLAEAQGGRGASIARAVLDAPASGASVAGTWRCRTIRLGGMTPEVVYSWFRCRVSERGGTLTFEKTGTQRIYGTLYRHESGGYVLLGALSAKGEPRHRYSGNGPAAGAQQTPDDVVGLLSATGPSSARLELPYPMQESVFDVIEMRR